MNNAIEDLFPHTLPLKIRATLRKEQQVVSQEKEALLKQIETVDKKMRKFTLEPLRSSAIHHRALHLEKIALNNALAEKETKLHRLQAQLGQGAPLEKTQRPTASRRLFS